MSKNNLNVIKTDILLKYNKYTDDELKKAVISKFPFLSLGRNLRFKFYSLLTHEPLTRKQSILFLTKFKESNQVISYLFRHMIRCAHHYGIPSTLIKKYHKTKKLMNLYKDNSSTYYKRYKDDMHDYSNIIFDATLEMIEKSKTRKFKINSLLDKMTKVDK